MRGLCAACAGVEQLASGENNAFALFGNGSVQGWGSDANGALGNGNAPGGPNPTYVRLTGNKGAVGIAAGGGYGVALMSDRTVEAWGQNNHGQLGDGTTNNSNVAVIVRGITHAVEVTAGNLYSLARLADGSVWAWGYNAYGQLGNGTHTDSSVPVRVVGLQQGVISISAGGNLQRNGHALAVLANGTVMAWGLNSSGELGDGTTSSSSVPVTVSDLTGVIRVSAGGQYSTALLANGTVAVWGKNGDGELGNGHAGGISKVPRLVPNLSRITLLSAGPPGHILVY